MPKLIDHERRREELALAVWRVISREGIGAVSVRTVATEAGVSTGSLRHLLPSKGLMLAAAMELVVTRGTERFLAHPPAVVSRADAVDWLGEMLPLDAERRLEMEMQLALLTEAASHEELHGLRAELYEALRRGCLLVLTLAEDGGLLRRGLDLDDQATRLHVLVDGLAFHLVGGHHRTTPEVARRLLDDHLAAIWRRGQA